MTIQILGGGCPNCQALASHAEQAIRSLGIEAEIVKVTDSDEIADMGVMLTPALGVDGVIKSSGKVLSAEEIGALLKDE
jgi:small redox-active disulfide protein 2